MIYNIDETAPIKHLAHGGRWEAVGSPFDQIRRAIHEVWGHVRTRDHIIGDPEVWVHAHKVIDSIEGLHEANASPTIGYKPSPRWMPFEAEVVYFDGVEELDVVTIVFSHHRTAPVVVCVKIDGVG